MCDKVIRAAAADLFPDYVDSELVARGCPPISLKPGRRRAFSERWI
jgi:hypothetical protein